MEERPRVGIGILIIKDNKVLLGKRYGELNDQNAQGTWSMPGGKLEFGEEIEDCGKRETMEESGIKVDDLELISLSNNITYGNHYITIGLLAKKIEGEPKIIEPNKIVEWKWFPLNELPEEMFLPSLSVINNYLKNKIYKGD